MAGGDRDLVLGEGSDLEVKDALHYRQFTLVLWPVVTESLGCIVLDMIMKVLFLANGTELGCLMCRSNCHAASKNYQCR